MSESTVKVRFYSEGFWEKRELTDEAGFALFQDLFEIYGERMRARQDDREDLLKVLAE